jgi:Polysaccharide biosynthesis C-terminal domain
VGETALRILLAGQVVNVATGSVGFVLIMTGFTGIDLFDNALGIALLVGLAAALTAAFGIEGTATAAAVSIAGLNVVRLFQVRSRVGIQPYERAYVRLAAPAVAAALAAIGAHALLVDRNWLVSLAGTAACGLAAYVVFLPVALPAEERAVLRARLPV